MNTITHLSVFLFSEDVVTWVGTSVATAWIYFCSICVAFYVVHALIVGLSTCRCWRRCCCWRTESSCVTLCYEAMFDNRLSKSMLCNKTVLSTVTWSCVFATGWCWYNQYFLGLVLSPAFLLLAWTGHVLYRWKQDIRRNDVVLAILYQLVDVSTSERYQSLVHITVGPWVRHFSSSLYDALLTTWFPKLLFLGALWDGKDDGKSPFFELKDSKKWHTVTRLSTILGHDLHNKTFRKVFSVDSSCLRVRADLCLHDVVVQIHDNQKLWKQLVQRIRDIASERETIVFNIRRFLTSSLLSKSLHQQAVINNRFGTWYLRFLFCLSHALKDLDTIPWTQDVMRLMVQRVPEPPMGPYYKGVFPRNVAFLVQGTETSGVITFRNTFGAMFAHGPSEIASERYVTVKPYDLNLFDAVTSVGNNLVAWYDLDKKLVNEFSL